MQYDPAESSSGLFGGSSNWRGPVWLPVKPLLLKALEHSDHDCGGTPRVGCGVGSARELSLGAVTPELSRPLPGLVLVGTLAKSRSSAGRVPNHHLL